MNEGRPLVAQSDDRARMGIEEELREANERLELIARATNDAVWDWDLATDSVWWNEGFYTLFGYSRQETEPTIDSWSSRLHPEDAKRVLDGIHAAIAAGRQVWTDEYRFRRGDGSFADVHDRGYLMHDESRRPVRMIGAMMDVSERRRGERAQEALYRIATAAASPGTLADLLRSIHEIVAGLMPARNLYIALQDPATQTLSLPYFVDEVDRPPADTPNLAHGLTAYVLRTGRPLLLRGPEDFGVLERAGEVVVVGVPAVSWLGVPLRAGERTVGVLATQSYSEGLRYGERDAQMLEFVSTQVARAIERKQAEEALRESERRFRALIENSADGITVMAADGSLIFRSASSTRILGFNNDEARGSIFDERVHPDDREQVRKNWSAMLASPGKPMPAQSRLRHKDGRWLVVESTLLNLLDDPAVRGVVINFRDITSRKQIEAQLLAADRMVSLGTLAAGVAHEINNPLAYVIANQSYVIDALIARQDEGTRDLIEALASAQEGAERVRRIVRDLKSFSRGDEPREGPVDVHQVLDSATNLAWNEIRHRARLYKDYGVGLPAVVGSEGRLGQVFVNLLINAAQAMPDGTRGEIRIRTSAAGGKVAVEIADSGAGIAPADLAHVFDAFFTTKPVVGTGLGLFICHDIVTSLGGTLAVSSEIGKGSTFRVELPVAAGEPSLRRIDSTPPAPARLAHVLVIDDEPQIGAALRRVLAPHDVVACTSAVEALRRLRAGERYDLVLCDLMIPGMNGMDLHAALDELSPELARRIVFVTGGAFTPEARGFLDRVANPCLEKPFDAAAIRAFIDERLRAADQITVAAPPAARG